MTLEQFQEASQCVEEINREHGIFRKAEAAYRLVKDGKVERVILVGRHIDGEEVEIHMQIPKDILLEAIEQSMDEYETHVDKLKEKLEKL